MALEARGGDVDQLYGEHPGVDLDATIRALVARAAREAGYEPRVPLS